MNQEIFTNQQWGLLNNYGIVSTVAPTMLNRQGVIDYCQFPSALGQNSKMRKIFRMIKEIKSFVGPNMQANRRAALIEYVPLFFWLIFRPLVDYNGSKDCIE